MVFKWHYICICQCLHHTFFLPMSSHLKLENHSLQQELRELKGKYEGLLLAYKQLAGANFNAAPSAHLFVSYRNPDPPDETWEGNSSKIYK
jgi:hypothetical protein